MSNTDTKLDYYSEIHRILNIKEEYDSGKKVIARIMDMMDSIQNAKKSIKILKQVLEDRAMEEESLNEQSLACLDDVIQSIT